MSKDLSQINPEYASEMAEKKFRCQCLAKETFVELEFDLSASNINKYLESKNYIVDNWRARVLAASSRCGILGFEKLEEKLNALSEDEVALSKLALYKFGYSLDSVHNDNTVTDYFQDFEKRRKELSFMHDGYVFFEALKKVQSNYTELQKLKEKKFIKDCKRTVASCNIKISALFVYFIICLFAYPAALGYALSQLHPFLGYIGFVCFWIQFELLSRKDDFLNIKVEELYKEKKTAKFYIINYSSLKDGSPIARDPDSYLL